METNRKRPVPPWEGRVGVLRKPGTRSRRCRTNKPLRAYTFYRTFHSCSHRKPRACTGHCSRGLQKRTCYRRDRSDCDPRARSGSVSCNIGEDSRANVVGPYRASSTFLHDGRETRVQRGVVVGLVEDIGQFFLLDIFFGTVNSCNHDYQE